ncbi:major facilitator superfamily domain-containing protein [Phascolomyces articulosus]|uniref:Major facilitator superfamily domain-containing protein n=1 Tax=Phascolomyces articulosus TaxID=60185 RepID=A0AAD5JMF9_9FUNG|nr:major facilitator superfamily domain-containing protein [Phascolomyces articulosus]
MLFDRKKNDEKTDAIHTEVKNGSNSDTASGISVDNEKGDGFQKPFVKSEAEERLVRKITYTIMPLVCWIIIVQFADKAALSVSAVLGIYEDTKISGSQFSWLGSLFFLGHLAFQPINSYLLQRFPIGRYLGVCIVLWGAVMLFTAMCHTFQQLAAVRFLLGLFEAACIPTIYLLVNTMYRRSEQTTYFGVVTMCFGLGSVVGNLVAFGISHMGTRLNIEMWRWNHIIFGAFTVFLGIMSFFFLADNQRSKLLRLTEEEKVIVEDRIQDNAVVRNMEIKKYQIWEALKEPRLWLMCIAAIGLQIQNGGLLVFSAQFIKGLGSFSSGESILLKMPGGVASTVGTILATFIARRTNQVCLTGTLMAGISLIGCIVLAAIPGGAVKLLGYYLSWASTGGYGLLATCIGNNVSGYTKKIFYNSMLVVFYTLGNFIGPLVMLEPPRYIGAMIGFCAGNGVAIICFIILRSLMIRENKRRMANPPEEEVDAREDLTDKENKSFIFRL